MGVEVKPTDGPSSPRLISGLATKITLPFIALFALVLLGLGVALSGQVLREVEKRVEDEQQIVLRFAMLPGIGYTDESLRMLRHRGRFTHTEFVALAEGKPAQSSLSRQDPGSWKIVEELKQVVEAHPERYRPDSDAGPASVQDLQRATQQSGQLEDIRRHDLLLNQRRFLLFHSTRPTGSGPGRSHLYLLYPRSEIDKAQNQALLRLATLGGVGLILMAVLGLVVAQWISRPVSRLAAAAQRLTAGGLNEPLEVLPAKHARGRDEIADLAQAFQSMVESLRASQAELLKAERLAVTGKLAASVAHEIRNPLTSLRMTLETLQQRGASADADTQEAYRILLGEIDRLALAVEELLTFARPRPARREPIDLNALVLDTLKFLERQLSHARVRGLAQPDPALPPQVLLDPNKIRQLLVNLILNAQQAIVRDGTVTLKTQWDSANNWVAISVQDTGPGVAEEVRERLFELFVTTKHGGGGLGLAIAKQIAEEHGGMISFQTSPSGTTFTVRLPVQAAASVVLKAT